MTGRGMSCHFAQRITACLCGIVVACAMLAGCRVAGRAAGARQQHSELAPRTLALSQTLEQARTAVRSLRVQILSRGWTTQLHLDPARTLVAGVIGDAGEGAGDSASLHADAGSVEFLSTRSKATEPAEMRDNVLTPTGRPG